LTLKPYKEVKDSFKKERESPKPITEEDIKKLQQSRKYASEEEKRRFLK
jgi:hypothetical protein